MYSRPSILKITLRVNVSVVDAGGNRSTQRKPAVFGRVKLTTPNYNLRKLPRQGIEPGLQQ